jgi:bifunctional non-homologous end joining protein LigD
VAALPVRSAVIDGEVVVLDERGRSNFGDLQAAMTRGGGRQAVMFAFDLLFYDGMDLRPWKLDARRAVLEGLIGDGHGTALVLSQEFEGHGGDIFAHACRLGLEGIVSKRRDRPYRSGKCEDWVKTKCVMSDEFVIIGYQPSSAFRGMLGAIHVATMLADRLHYAGAVGSGFSEKAARGLKSRLDKLVSQTPVISNLKIKDAVWCRPEIRAEIAYRDVTREGMLRHASFKSIVGDDSGA